MNESTTINKDHYVPKFYLKNWYSTDEKLRSSRVDIKGKELQWKPFSAKGICYEKGLYKEQEENFYKPLDNDCTSFVREILSKKDFGKLKKLDIRSKDHELWAKYILSQIIRIPSNIHKMKLKYDGISESVVLEAISGVASNSQALLDLRKLTWIVGDLRCDKQLITSDNPVIFEPKDLSNSRCYIIMPLSPKHFFLATKKENISMFPSNPELMVKFINRNIYRTANKRIIACDPNKVVGLELV